MAGLGVDLVASAILFATEDLAGAAFLETVFLAVAFLTAEAFTVALAVRFLAGAFFAAVLLRVR